MSNQNPDESPDTLESVTLTRGGVAASMKEATREALVAPTLEAATNTIRRELRPIGCWRASDARFEFDSSFPRPELRSEMRVLERRLKAHPGCLLSVFGHADPVGNDDYNKELSGKRAQAIYGLLTRRVDRWEDLYQRDDSWGERGIGRMLDEVFPDEPDPDDFEFDLDADDDGDAGETGSDEPEAAESATLEERITAFQESEGLATSGEADEATRARLFELYMDRLCVDINDEIWSLPPERFLGKGADEGGKADYQGCGEFNPILLLSREERDAFAGSSNKAERNAANAPNRRVLILLFPEDIEVDPAAWPCPRAGEGVADCRKRLWSDHATRRSHGAERREFKETFDTFACRFYDRIAGCTPCERQVPVPTMLIRIQLHDFAYRPCPGVRYQLMLETGEEILGFTDGQGWLQEQGPVREQEVRVRYRPEGEDTIVESRAFVGPDPARDKKWVRRNVRSFGFSPADGDKNDPIVLFQAAHRELDLTGKPDETTTEAVEVLLDESLEQGLGESDG